MSPDPSARHIANARESHGTYFFAVKDPEGAINHTTVAMDEDWCVEMFLSCENTFLVVTNAARAEHGKSQTYAKSWEQFEAEGFSIATVRIEECEIPKHAEEV